MYHLATEASWVGKMNSIQVNTKELKRFHSGCHGNLLAVEMKKVAGAYCPKKPSWLDMTIRQRSY